MQTESHTEPPLRRPAGVGVRLLHIWLLMSMLIWTGCGTTKSYTATEQLLLSDAVDAAVAQLDFSPLTAKRVYLDSTYLRTVKSAVLIDSDYVISSLRQQMVSAGVLLVEGREEADIVAEARMGALGMDGHNVVYGIPASNSLSSASAAFAGTPILPTIPEISFARREGRQGASKLAVFAYDRETRQPYWQSGVAKSVSDAKDTWVLGVGPFQRGTIHDGTRFAGGGVLEDIDPEAEQLRNSSAFADYNRQRRYAKAKKKASEVVPATEDGGGEATEDGSGEATEANLRTEGVSPASAAVETSPPTTNP